MSTKLEKRILRDMFELSGLCPLCQDDVLECNCPDEIIEMKLYGSVEGE